MWQYCVLWISACLLPLTAGVSKCTSRHLVSPDSCDGEGNCPGGFQCENGFCCPIKVTQITGPSCPTGDYIPSTSCGEESPCDAGFACHMGWCCPKRVNAGHTCSNSGIQSQLRCDSESNCMGLATCENGWCCPSRINTDNKCSDSPLFKATQQCGPENACLGGMMCENGWCCPKKINTNNKCSDSPLFKATQQCGPENACLGGMMCENGWCCPKKINTNNNKCSDSPLFKATQQCGPENACLGGMMCENGWCCPKKININAKCSDSPTFRATQQCGPENACLGGMMCENGWCCPKKININANCLDSPTFRASQQCDAENKCSGGMICKNGWCCPMRININAKCSGSPTFKATQQCGPENKCSGGMICERGWCCPIKYNANQKCSNSDTFVPQQQCDGEGKCRGPFRCDNGWCCPYRLNIPKKICSGGMNAFLDADANLVTCSKDKPCSSVAAECENGFCCPRPINLPDIDFCNGTSNYLKDTDGHTLTCSDNKSCGTRTAVCQGGHCCPIPINTALCPKMSKPLKDDDGYVKTCIGGATCGKRSGVCYRGICCHLPKKTDDQCPVISPGEIGTCVEDCTFDTDCRGNKVCCSNNCGHVCRDPVKKTKTNRCPARDKDIIGVCVGNERRGTKCDNDKACPGEELCCNNGCEYVCTAPDKKTDCQRELESATLQVVSRDDPCTPVFFPRCDRNGNYHRTQCYDHNGMCFCVHPNGTQIPGTETRGNPDCSKATRPGVCPKIVFQMKQDLICNNSCGSDDDCGRDKKCCSNGCGYHCVDPIGGAVHKNSKLRLRRDAPAAVFTCPDNMTTSTTCGPESYCHSAYQCIQGYCCPIAFNQDNQVYSCSNGARSTSRCDPEGNCASGISNCESGFCCPRKINNVYSCSNGARSTRQCDSEGNCASGNSKCESGFCCPQKINNGPICIYRRYIDTTVTYVGVVATGTMPSVDACKAACDRDTIADCIGVVYQKNNNGRCTKYSDKTHVTKVPLSGSEYYERLCQFSAGLCPNQSKVLMSDGVPKTCNLDMDCGVLSFSCQDGHCCPIKLQAPGDDQSDLCRRNIPPLRDADGNIKNCTEWRSCGMPATCENGICCPAPINKGLCPNNGRVLMEDGQPKNCTTSSDCGGGSFSCQGTPGSMYCCPQKMNTDVCPNRGRPMIVDRAPKLCSTSDDCGSRVYSCQDGSDGNKYCCPRKINISDMCPNNAMVLIADGMPKRCTLTADCLNSGSGIYTCVNNFCCPRRINSDSCPHNGKALMEDNQPRTCTDNIECQGSGKGFFSCQEGYCCPEKVNQDFCPWNGMVMLTDGKPKKCLDDSDCSSNRYSCLNGYCCPQKINTVCADGTTPQCCDISLCLRRSCPFDPSAKCRINPCGGCKVEFYDDTNNLVNCDAALTTCEKQRQEALSAGMMWVDTTLLPPSAYAKFSHEDYNSDKTFGPPSVKATSKTSTKFGECPGVPVGVGIVTAACEKDDDCLGDRKCCFNGAGRSCTFPLIVSRKKKVPVCEQPALAGPCYAYFERYFYNSTSEMCEKFVFGGCQSNQNNFQTLEACERACVKGLPDHCLQPREVGLCRAYFPMFFYNVTSNRCEQFVYGGCGGNSNRFATEVQCYTSCSTGVVKAAPCETMRCPADTVCVVRNAAKAECVSGTLPPLAEGIYVPDCASDGSFSEMQCQGPVCWCVNSTGHLKPGTVRVGKPPCFTIGGVEQTDDNSKKPVCRNGKQPKLCKDSCRLSSCVYKDVKCLADPCDNCKVSVVDKKGNIAHNCFVDKCTVTKPARLIESNSTFGCGNSVRRWYYDAASAECKHFKYSACLAENFINFFPSQWECQSQCKGSICNGEGPKTCLTTCMDQQCKRFPTAKCKVNPCTCEIEFFDPVSDEPVNCEKVTSICQLRRSQEKQREITQSVSNLKIQDLIVISQCSDEGEFFPQQCDDERGLCWCVDGVGNVQGPIRKVQSSTENLNCRRNNTVSAVVAFSFDVDYNTVVLGREENFKRVISEKLMNISPELYKFIKSIKIRRGSVIVEIEIDSSGSQNTNKKDVGAFVNLLESEVNNGFEVSFENQVLTAKRETTSRMQFEAQSQEEGVPNSPVADSNSVDTATVVIVIVVCGVALVVIVAAVFIVKKRRSSNKDFSALEETGHMNSSNAVYFNNQACEKK